MAFLNLKKDLRRLIINLYISFFLYKYRLYIMSSSKSHSNFIKSIKLREEGKFKFTTKTDDKINLVDWLFIHTANQTTKKIELENVLLDDLNIFLFKKYGREAGNSLYSEALKNFYEIFIMYFMIKCCGDSQLYRLDKLDDSLNISKIDFYTSKNPSYTNEDTITYKKFEEATLNKDEELNKILDVTEYFRTISFDTKNFFRKDILNNEYSLYRTLRNDYILCEKSQIKKGDLEKIVEEISKKIDETYTLSLNKIFNLPKYLKENDKNFYNLLAKKATHTAPGFNYTEIVFDITETIYTDYIKNTITRGGGNKYNIHTNKKTNLAYINYNNKKSYFYKNDNKIYIKINNNIVYLTKKSISYDEKLNSYFVKI